ncbi:MAG: hypothetical protein HY078_10750 [Elusimicrobia bacterium]|nr:hypothetical protein [Elusimicrobiota bacterium]
MDQGQKDDSPQPLDEERYLLRVFAAFVVVATLGYCLRNPISSLLLRMPGFTALWRTPSIAMTSEKRTAKTRVSDAVRSTTPRAAVPAEAEAFAPRPSDVVWAVDSLAVSGGIPIPMSSTLSRRGSGGPGEASSGVVQAAASVRDAGYEAGDRDTPVNARAYARHRGRPSIAVQPAPARVDSTRLSGPGRQSERMEHAYLSDVRSNPRGVALSSQRLAPAAQYREARRAPPIEEMPNHRIEGQEPPAPPQQKAHVPDLGKTVRVAAPRPTYTVAGPPSGFRANSDTSDADNAPVQASADSPDSKAEMEALEATSVKGDKTRGVSEEVTGVMRGARPEERTATTGSRDQNATVQELRRVP